MEPTSSNVVDLTAKEPATLQIIIDLTGDPMKLLSLSSEIWGRVLVTSENYKTLCSLARTCHSLNQAVEVHAFWKYLVEVKFRINYGIIKTPKSLSPHLLWRWHVQRAMSNVCVQCWTHFPRVTSLIKTHPTQQTTEKVNVHY
jgi:hypothetical protein